ncbi:hypothetical protein OAQ71_00070 [bacterium]|nr:hypothetical protein [bacterium]
MPGNGKSAYLWSLGEVVPNRVEGGFRFTELGLGFQRHHTELSQKLTVAKKGGWSRTEVKGKGDQKREIAGGEMDLFQVHRARLLGARHGLQVRSMDLPGETVAQDSGFKIDSDAQEEGVALKSFIERSSACLIVARAGIVEGHKDLYDRVPPPPTLRDLRNFIQRSLSLLKEGDQSSTAIVLTACDEITSEEWRDKLGFGKRRVSRKERWEQARLFLLEHIEGLGSVFEAMPGLRVMAVSPFGQDPEGNKERVAVNPKPKYVLDPLLWVLEREFSRREASRAAIRKRIALMGMAAMCLVAGVATHLVTSPLFRALGRGGVTSPASVELSEVPTAALAARKGLSLPGLFSEAVRSARATGAKGAKPALRALATLDSGGYFFSRAFLEVSRLDAQLGAGVEAAGSVGADSLARELSLLEELGGNLDRYGQTMLDLRRLERAAGSISSPGDAATGALLGGLEANPQLALQHGGDLLIGAWRAWSDAGLRKNGVEQGLLQMEAARAVLPVVEWRRVWEVVAPEMVGALLRSGEPGFEDTLLRVFSAGGPEPEMERIGRDALSGLLERGESRPESEEGQAALRFGAAFSDRRALQVALPECLPMVLDTLIRGRKTGQLLRLDRSILGGLSASTAAPTLAAEWSVITTASRLELESRLRSLLSLVLDGFVASDPAGSLALFERFRYVVGVAAGRARVLEERVAPLLAEAAAFLLEQDELVDELSASDLRGLLDAILRDTSEEGVLRVCRVSEGLDRRQAALGVEGLTELLVGLRRWADVADASGVDVPGASVVAAEVDRLGERLVAETLDEVPSIDAASLARTIACRYLIPLEPRDAAVLEGNALVICEELLSRGEWGHEASLAMASLLAPHPAPQALLDGWGRSRSLFTELKATADDRLDRGAVPQVATLFRAMTALDPSGLERYLLATSDGGARSRGLTHALLIARVEGGLQPSDPTGEILRRAARRALDQRLSVLADSVRIGPDELSELDALVALGGTVRASGSGGLSSRAMGRLHLEWMLAAAGDAAQDRPKEARARLARIDRTGPVDARVFRRAVAELDLGVPEGPVTSLSDVMAGLFEVRARGQQEDLGVRTLIDDALREILRSDADIEGLEGYVDCLEVLLGEAPEVLARPELKAPLAARLKSVAAEAAGRGDLPLTTKVWRLGARFREQGLADLGTWPLADGGVASKLLGGSALARTDGWSPSAMGAAHAELLSSPGVDSTVVVRIEQAMVRGLIEDLRGMKGEAALRQATFTTSLLVAIRPSGPTSGAADRAWVDLVGEVFSWTLLEAPSPARLTAFERVVSDGQDSELADRVLGQVQAISPSADTAHALLVSAGSSTRPALFTPILSRWTRLDCPLTVGQAASAVSAFRSDLEWPAGTVDQVIRWLVSAAKRDIRAVTGPQVLSAQALTDWAGGLGELLDASRFLPAPRSGSSARSALEAGYADAVRGALKSGDAVRGALNNAAGARRVASLADALKSHPVVAEPANLFLIREALYANNWGEFARRSERIETASLSVKLVQFASVAAAGTRVELTGGGTAFLLNDEVSAGDFRTFLDAMMTEPRRVATIAAACGASSIRSLDDLLRQSPEKRLEDPRVAARGMSLDAALMYAEWSGCDLPTLEVMLECWGEGLFPWGGAWDPSRTNTGERGVGRGPADLEVVDASRGDLRHLHGNVSEFVLSQDGLDEVLLFGGDVSRPGLTVTRARCTRSFSPSSKDRTPASTPREFTGLRLMAVPPLEIR